MDVEWTQGGIIEDSGASVNTDTGELLTLHTNDLSNHFLHAMQAKANRRVASAHARWC